MGLSNLFVCCSVTTWFHSPRLETRTKPTRFSMMLDDSSIVVNAPDPKPKIKKEPMEKRGPKKKRGRPGRPKKGSFGPLAAQIKTKRKNEAQNESMDHDYHHPK